MTGTDEFLKSLKESNRKPNKMWINKGIKFNNSSMKSFLQKK